MAKGIKNKARNEMLNNSVSTILDENAKEALDLLFAKDQQTYDEFRDSFLYLPKDNNKLSSTNSHPLAQLEEHDVTGNGINTSDVINGETNCEIDLQQEILGPGDCCPSEKDRPNLSKLQLDKFVDDESSLSDDDHVDYCPSICQKISRIKESHVTSAPYSTSEGTFDDGLTNRMVTLPGETEICDSTNVVVNLRSLNICTKLSESSECVVKSASNSVYQEVQESCEVVPFKMDDNFDYDNVQLQPKFRFPVR